MPSTPTTGQRISWRRSPPTSRPRWPRGESPVIVGGADGCRTGWVICRRDADGSLDIRVVKTLAEACEGLAILAVDMPIGFVDTPRPGRECEGQAPRLLPGKASSAFPTPCRPALACMTHADANATRRT